MAKLARLGRLLFAIAMAAFGFQYLGHALLATPVPGPPWSPGRPLWAYAAAMVLIIVAAAYIAIAKKMRLAAALLAIVLLLRALVVFVPRLVAHVHDPGPWTSGFEILAMCGAALVLSGTLVWLGRILFAVPLLVFRAQHFLYARFVATLVPAWIPWHLFWAIFVGVAFVAAGAVHPCPATCGVGCYAVGTDVFLVGVCGASASSGCGLAQWKRMDQHVCGPGDVWRSLGGGGESRASKETIGLVRLVRPSLGRGGPDQRMERPPFALPFCSRACENEWRQRGSLVAMRTIALAIICLLMALASAAQVPAGGNAANQKQPALCAVSGQVVTAAEGAPLKSSRIVLIQQDTSSQSSSVFATTTDSDGRFEIKKIAPGRYTFFRFSRGLPHSAIPSQRT